MQVILECESRLVPLFERSFAQAKVVAKNDPADAMTAGARWQSPLGSLGRWLRTHQTSFVQQRPYLKADPAKVAELRQRYHAWGQGPLIGISWRSSNEKFGAHKSMTLADWAPLLAIPGITFINLQYGDCDAEISQLKIDTGSVVHQDGNVNALKDLDGFSAQVAAMDLVISTSNSTVHFAGALGIPVWALLPRGRAGLMWYWSNEGAECLWYPSMRLYRQEIPGDWAELISRISEALRSYRTAFV
jgi:ADP-heptose:LPS heptosyltransferase